MRVSFSVSRVLGIVWLLLAAAPASAQSQASLTARTITVMGTVCGLTPGGDLQTVSCAIAGGAGGAQQQQQNALSISPREQTAASSTATHTTDSQVEAEKDRLERARGEAADGAPRLGGFFNGTGAWGEVDERGEAERYDVTGGGAMAGVDYRVSEQLIVGAGLGWNRQVAEFDEEGAADGSGVPVGGGEIDSNSYTASFYSSLLQGPVSVDGVLTYTYVDYEFDRPLNFPSTGVANQSAHGRTNADQIGASVSLSGYSFDVGGAALAPIAGVDFRRTWIEGYDESGVTNLALDYEEQDITSLVSSLGGEASFPVSMSFGVLVPHLRVTWEHEFENDARDIDARLFISPTDPRALLFSRTESPDRDYARVGAGVSAQFRGGVSAFLDYDGLVGLSDVRHHRLTAGGRIEF